MKKKNGEKIVPSVIESFILPFGFSFFSFFSFFHFQGVRFFQRPSRVPFFPPFIPRLQLLSSSTRVTVLPFTLGGVRLTSYLLFILSFYSIICNFNNIFSCGLFNPTFFPFFSYFFPRFLLMNSANCAMRSISRSASLKLSC